MDLIIAVLGFVRDVVAWCFGSLVRLETVVLSVATAGWLARNAFAKNAAKKAAEKARRQAEEVRLRRIADAQRTYERYGEDLKLAREKHESARTQMRDCDYAATMLLCKHEYEDFWVKLEEGLRWWSVMYDELLREWDIRRNEKKLLAEHPEIVKRSESACGDRIGGIGMYLDVMALSGTITAGQKNNDCRPIYERRRCRPFMEAEGLHGGRYLVYLDCEIHRLREYMKAFEKAFATLGSPPPPPVR